MPKVAAIVVAYNESKTIGPVVKTIVESGMCDEVIVISDGSTDKTAELAQQAGATLVHQLPIKGGKGAAILHGLVHTDAPILFFADADLYGLTSEHIKIILQPVLDGKKAMNVGLRDRGKLSMKIAKHMPLIGGERALMRHLINRIKPEFVQGFMLESALNYHCRIDKLSYGTTPCFGLKIRRKMQKVGIWKGLWEYVEMVFQIIKAMILVRWAHFRGRLK